MIVLKSWAKKFQLNAKNVIDKYFFQKQHNSEYGTGEGAGVLLFTIDDTYCF